MKKVLGSTFFARPTVLVARSLLGKFLVRKIGKREIALMITETEAYDGFKDMASHAHRGMTERNKIMFGPAGYWYVYFTYGMHWMLNVTTGKRGYPAAVLLRGVKGINGPARLTKFLRIGKKLNKKKATRASGLWIEDRNIKIPNSRVTRGPRVGVTYAGRIWRKKPYRFWIEE